MITTQRSTCTESQRVDKRTIVFVAMGTRGDVQPYIPIALNLKRRGYRIRIVAYDNFHEFVQGYGFDGEDEFVAFEGSFIEIMQSKEGQEALAKGNILGIMKIVERLKPFMPKNEEIIIDACSGPDVAAVVASTVMVSTCSAVAEKLGLPLFYALPVPVQPSPELLPIYASSHTSRFKLLNSLTHSVIGTLVSLASKGDVNRFRVNRLGLLPMSGDPFSFPVPTYNLYSPTVLPPSAAWDKSHIVVAGYPVLEEKESRKYEPPPLLVKFLEAGEQPVYLGFGSMPILDTKNIITIASEVLATLGLRGVICAGWSDVDTKSLPEHLHLVRDVPHDWLFPQCRAIVHHGGAGTTGSAILSGKPMVIFPVIADQTWWSSVAASHGVAPKKATPFSKFSRGALLEGLTFATSGEAQRKALELGEAVRKERNGADVVAEDIARRLESGDLYVPKRTSRPKGVGWFVSRAALTFAVVGAIAGVYMRYYNR